MSVQEAKIKLELARKKMRNLKQEIEQLRQIIFDAGEEPDPWRIDYTPRNKEMYKRWKDGLPFTTIAKEYELSPSRVSSVCNRIEKILELKKWQYDVYKDLLKYKPKKLPKI